MPQPQIRNATERRGSVNTLHVNFPITCDTVNRIWRGGNDTSSDASREVPERTHNDTPKEAKLHGRQCPFRASLCELDSQVFLVTRPKTAVVGGRLGETPLPPRGKSIAPNRGLPRPEHRYNSKTRKFTQLGISGAHRDFYVREHGISASSRFHIYGSICAANYALRVRATTKTPASLATRTLTTSIPLMDDCQSE